MNQSKDFSACIEELLDQGVLVCIEQIMMIQVIV